MKAFRKIITIILIISLTASMMVYFASANTRTIAWGAANAAGDGVRIRSGAGLDYEVITHANRGDPIVILEKTNNEWYLVNFNGVIGYASVPLLDRPRTVADFNANGRTLGSDVNIRERPSASSNSLGYYAAGTVMAIIGLNEGWYKVRYDNKTGYVRSDLMEVIPSIGTLGISTTQITGKLTASQVNMRATPGTNAAILGTYAHGTVMNVLGKVSNWYKVQHDGKTGYVRSDLMQVSATPPDLTSTEGNLVDNSGSHSPAPAYNAALGQQVVDLAMQYAGVKYVYGGSSPSGFDCSGFTSYVYKQFGVTLTRNASGQYRNDGTRISRSELKPGDLVYTSSNGSTVNHASLYIGDGKVIHASSSAGKVVISNLNVRGYIGAIRVV